MDFLLNILIFTMTFVILTQSYNLVLGYTGMIHVGHIAFMAIGAYSSSLLSLHGVPVLLAMFIGIIFAGITGFILGLPTVRFREDYLVVATLGLGELVRSILLNWTSVTRGPLGLHKIPEPSLFGFSIDTNAEYFIFVLIIAVLVNLFIYRITHSPFGRVLEAIREDEIATKTIGKNTVKYKIIVLIVGAIFAGLAGVLNAHFSAFIEPSVFNINRMAFVLLIVILGGGGTFWGPIIGTAILYIFFEALRLVPLPPQMLGALRWMIFSSLLIAIMIFKPTGILGKKLLKKKY